MTLAVEIAAMKDLRRVERAAARRAKALGIEPPSPTDEISDHERASALGRAVRLEVDVCIPLAELKLNLQSIRNEAMNALAAIDRYATGSEKRKAAHWAMGKAKSEIYYRKRERQVRELRKPQAEQ